MRFSILSISLVSTRYCWIVLFLFFAGKASSQWTAICDHPNTNGFVVSFENYDNALFATGFFKKINNVTCNYVARWDGSNWLPVGNGLDEAGHTLKVINNDLFVARYEPAVDSNWLYQFDGANFQKFGEGVYLTTAVPGFSQTASLYGIQEFNGKMVVSGEFDRVGTKHISGIMEWNGTEWDSLGAGLSGNIPNTAPVMYPHDMCIFNGDLIVAGNFKKAGGQNVYGIARWDGNQWYPMGAGFNSTVYGVGVYNGELYAGGDFTGSGSTPLTALAKWDGASWVSPGFSLFYHSPSDYTYIHTIKPINGRLYISGGFDRAVVGTDTLMAQAIVAYDGNSINTLSGGLVGQEVEAITTFEGDLVAGGGLNGVGYVAIYAEPSGTGNVPAAGAGMGIFPNPADAYVRVQREGGEAVRFAIRDCLGVAQKEGVMEGELLELSSLPAGYYWITFYSKRGNQTLPLVIRH